MQIADGLRPELRNVIENGTVTIRQEISVAQFDGRLTLRVLTMQFGGYTKPKYKVFLRVAISDGTNIRFLNYHENGNYCEWVSSSTEIEYEEQVLSGYSSSAQIPISAFNAKEFAIPGIPITGTLGVFITAKRTSFLSDPCDFFLGGVYLSQDAVPGYKDTIVIDNGARGSAGDAVSVFGDAPYTPNGLKNVLNVTADGNGVITTDWQTSKFGGELLSVIAMDRALGVALPRLLSKGVLNVPSNAGLPAVIVNPDGIPMLIQRSSWKLLDDEVEVEILSVPAGSVEITSESIVPISEDQAEAITGGTAGTSGGGWTPSTPVPEEKLFEAIYGNGGITGAKALYDIFIKQVEEDPQQGIEEQLKNATEILKHLFLVPNDGRPYIRSDIGFVSEDFVSGAGLSTTQGGGGGGGSIATLSDVSLSGLANGNILRYDASVGMWRNEALNLGTAASYNIGIVAQGDNGLVTGGAVYDAINTILSSAVKFVGITTTALTDGSTTSTVTIYGASHTAQRGDVVIYGGKEFLWTGSKWQQMGDEASWALKTVTITGTGYLTGGGTLEANRTIDIADGIKTMIQHGDTAYGWGNHATAGYVTNADISAALAGYLPLTGGTLTGNLTINALLYTGYIYGSGEQFRLYVLDTISNPSVYRYIIRWINDTDAGTNVLYIGSGTQSVAATYIYGKQIRLIPNNGTSGVNALNVTSDGNVGIGVTSTSLKLDVAGDIRARNRLYIGSGGAYIEVDSSGNLHTASGFYSDSFVSGSGLSTTQGGGGGGVDLAAMWNSLTNSVTDPYANTPIDIAHIPDITTAKISDLEGWILGKGYATTSALAGYLPLTGGTLTGDLTINANYPTVKFASMRVSPSQAGWAVDSIQFNDATNAAVARIGWRGDGIDPRYMYIGFGTYAANNNLRIYPDGVRFGGNIIWHQGNDGLGSGLDADLLDGKDGSYYATAASLDNYVSGVTVYGDYLRVTKGAANTDLTIPYAVYSTKIEMQTLYSESGIANEYSLRVYSGAGSAWTGTTGSPWTDMAYGATLAIGTPVRGWHIWARYGSQRSLFWRNGVNTTTWESEPHRIYDDKNLTQGVITSIIGNTTYAPYNTDGYLPLSGGTLTGALTVNSSLTTTGTIIAGNNIHFSRS